MPTTGNKKKITPKSKLVQHLNITAPPNNKQTSPILLTNKALIAALTACTLENQKLINKNEKIPTPSQAI